MIPIKIGKLEGILTPPNFFIWNMPLPVSVARVEPYTKRKGGLGGGEGQSPLLWLVPPK